MTNSRSRISGLDGLRGIAAVAVMLFHFDFMFLPAAHVSQIVPLSHAYLSVDLFFIMSGYVMAHVYGDRMADNWREAWKPFARARVGRVYPLFILTLSVLVGVYATGYISSRFVTFSAGTLALQPFMLQALNHGMNWNFPSWSIGTEAAAYSVFVVAARPMLMGRRPWLIAGVLLAAIAAMCALKHGRLEFASQLPAYIRTFAGFGLGVLIFRTVRGHRDRTREIALMATGPVLIAAWLTQNDFFTYCAMACIVSLAVTGSFRVLNWTPFRTLGDWSFGIYLWHTPFSFAIMAFAAANGYRLTSLPELLARLLMAAAAVLVVVISGLIYHFFEIPARRSIRMNFQRRVALEGVSG